MAITSLGDITSYKRLYMQFRDSIGKTVNLTLDNPKSLDDEEYDALEAQSDTIGDEKKTNIEKNKNL